MKIVINTYFGGFSLSRKAIELARKKGAEWALENSLHTLLVEDDWDYYFPEVERNDPILVDVVEELGEEANGNSATLGIVEIPDDVEWIIEEDEGREWVSERHRTWSCLK